MTMPGKRFEIYATPDLAGALRDATTAVNGPTGVPLAQYWSAQDPKQAVQDIGGGSDHMLRFDPLESTNPWSPWLGMWETLTRKLERGGVLEPSEILTREQALRLYTINNAYLNREEKEKGSLEVGKLGDMIIVDRDILTCPVDDIRETKVLTTIMGGKVVYERK